MKQLLSWLVSSYHGSNRLSLWLRTKIEHLPVRALVGAHLAGAAFFSAVVIPQASDLASNIEVLQKTQETYVQIVTSEDKFQWPLPSFGISQYFSFVHPGLDLTAPIGTPVKPVSDGWVAWTNTLSWGYGKHLLIESDKGIKSLYAHLSEVEVKPGDTVTKDTEIGKVGVSGWTTGSHLHLEVYQDDTPVNPQEVLPALSLQK